MPKKSTSSGPLLAEVKQIAKSKGIRLTSKTTKKAKTKAQLLAAIRAFDYNTAARKAAMSEEEEKVRARIRRKYGVEHEEGISSMEIWNASIMDGGLAEKYDELRRDYGKGGHLRKKKSQLK